jgi:hypothetical protein
MDKRRHPTRGCPTGRPAGAGHLAATLLGLCASATLNAGESHATLNVSITVPPITRLEVLSQASTLQITAEDRQRGYVEVSEPMRLSVYSNDRNGFALVVLPMSPLIRAIAVRGMGAEVVLGATGGRIVERWDRPQATALALTFRLALAPGAVPGVYTWPLHLAVEPLAEAT